RNASPARTSRAGFGVSPKRTLPWNWKNFRKPVMARRLRYPELYRDAREQIATVLLLFLATSICYAQDSSPTPAPESEPIVITGTRTHIPLDQAPASTSIVTSQPIEERQNERVADALRQVPGPSLLRSGT